MSQPSDRDELVTSTKSFGISKHVVLDAYRRVKANRGAAGIDNQSIEMFEANRRVPGSWGCAMQQVCALGRAGDLDTSVRRSRVNRR